jgi:hypothetical protein
MKIHEIPSGGSRSYTYGRTDRLDKNNTLLAFERVESVLTGISGIATVTDVAEMPSALGSAAWLVP